MNETIIFFITPTHFCFTQKANLIRLSQTLSHINNLLWIVVEDSDTKSLFIDEIIYRSKLSAVHLIAKTPSDKKVNINEDWKVAKGVNQRNEGLLYLR